MIDLSLSVLAGASLCVFVGAVIRGFTGFGFGIAATPLLVLLFPPAEIVPPILILQVLAGIQIYLRTRGHVDWKLLWSTLVGALVGIPLGSLVLDLLDSNTMRLIIGVAVLLAAALLASGFRFKMRPPHWLSGGLGILAGIGSGAAGIPGPPVIVLFLSSPVSLAIGRASLSAFFLFVATLSSASAAWRGLMTLDSVVLGALLMAPLLIGNHFGDKLFARVNERTFRRVALLLLFAIGVSTIARGFWDSGAAH
ncbi:sulfite exporter TauE/SafE family protein [Dongia deserti]|uniref:sulfite exporter TauE/SafE family protein n=1 Tax=Dongia deserti TaxID=2268030 RepID=UPI000E65AE9B|nr:sulfite exporter TauE/SafE family protein [Dongia deserti]